MAEKVVRKRGWNIQRNFSYDSNDPTSKYHNCDENTWREGIVEEWSELGQAKNVQFCHFIFHDSDEVKDENGKITIKPLHAHAVVRFKNARTQSAVMKEWCGSNERSEHVQWVDPRKGGYRSSLLYLTHHTTSAYNAEKTWYHHSNIYQFGSRFLDLIKTDSRKRQNKQDLENAVDEIVEKLMSGEMVLSKAKELFLQEEGASALVKYSDTFEKAFAEYREFKTKEMKRLSSTGQFEKVTTFISGPGRSGKSTLAEVLAADRFGHDDVFVAPTGGTKEITNDFVDGYETEKATVFGDVEPTEYGERSFYNMFDPSKWSLTKSRNPNKPWLSTACYIAVDMTVGRFVVEMLSGRKGSRELILSEENANKLRMSFGRVKYSLHYDKDNAGNGIIWVGRLKKDIPSINDIIDYAKSNIGNKLDGDIIKVFYDTLGYVPYDNSLVEPYEFHQERERIAPIINAVYDGDLNVQGFVRK